MIRDELFGPGRIVDHPPVWKQDLPVLGNLGLSLSYLIVAVCVGSVVGCSSDQVVCTTDVRPAVIVEVRDGASGISVADGARGFVRDGDYSEALVPYAISGESLVSFQAAGERSGTYFIYVERDGYVPWDTTEIRVGEDECHVRTVTIVASLTRLAGGQRKR